MWRLLEKLSIAARAAVFLSSSLVLTAYAQEVESPIETRVEQWQPVVPGQWNVTTKKFDMGHEHALPSMSTRASTCPFSSLFFLRSRSSVKLGKPGCQFRTFKLSKNEYHIVAQCRTLANKDHYETTTLTVSNQGKGFSSATTWIEPTGSVTLRSEGTWIADCRKE